MIKELRSLPTGVIGFEATGKLGAEDYRDVVLPALERASAGGEVSRTAEPFTVGGSALIHGQQPGD